MGNRAQTPVMLVFEVINFSCSDGKFQRGICTHLCIFKETFGAKGPL